MLKWNWNCLLQIGSHFVLTLMLRTPKIGLSAIILASVWCDESQSTATCPRDHRRKLSDAQALLARPRTLLLQNNLTCIGGRSPMHNWLVWIFLILGIVEILSDTNVKCVNTKYKGLDKEDFLTRVVWVTWTKDTRWLQALYSQLCLIQLIVIAMGDDYWFHVFGLSPKLWLNFQGLFFISLRVVDFTFLLQNWLNGIT